MKRNEIVEIGYQLADEMSASANTSLRAAMKQILQEFTRTLADRLTEEKKVTVFDKVIALAQDYVDQLDEQYNPYCRNHLRPCIGDGEYCDSDYKGPRIVSQY
jgi:hypothetical protein